MATYKKRGGKVRREKISDAEDAQQIDYTGESTTKEVFDTLDETASKSEQWLEKNQKPVFIFLATVLFAVLAFVAYTKFVKGPKEITAANELVYSKKHFFDAEKAITGKDSLYTIALNGVDGKYGLVDIAKKYSTTKAGNMANYMAGIAYLKKNDYQNAIDYLSKFSSDDDALIIQAKGNIGDAFADIDQLEDALTYYKKAANLKNSSFFTPMYLLKAGNIALELGKFDEALSMFERIKKEYPKADEAKKIDIFIHSAKYATKK
ncbi:MAG: tetratricopeptide repeat protein [Flavobacteriaceae bacterium]|nr:tetratricopeptide repeat protein [Flavobacteriaceae bacterium]